MTIERDKLLCSADELSELGSTIRIIDCGSPDAFRRAHIPGAVGLPVHPYVKHVEDNRMFSADEFSHLIGSLGVDNDTQVIAYDEFDSLYAARLWWVLRYFGHENVRVLDGGWKNWVSGARQVSVEHHPIEPKAFRAEVNHSLLSTREYLAERLGEKDFQVLDVRSSEEWRGENNRGNRRAGHLPGAIHHEWKRAVTEDSHRLFKSADEIRQQLTEAGFQFGLETVTHCQAGIRAAHSMFVLTLLGEQLVRNYDGSMKEWANLDDTALE